MGEVAGSGRWWAAVEGGVAAVGHKGRSSTALSLVSRRSVVAVDLGGELAGHRATDHRRTACQCRRARPLFDEAPRSLVSGRSAHRVSPVEPTRHNDEILDLHRQRQLQ